MTIIKSALFVLLFLAVPVFADGLAGFKRLSVVTSIRPLALLVQDLAGQWVDVDVVVPPNADPHNLSLKASARIKLDKADMVVWLGPDFERFLAKSMRQRGNPVDLALESVEGLLGTADEHHHEHSHGHDHSAEAEVAGDLHVWLSPNNAERILIAISARLSQLRPELKVPLEQQLERVLVGIKAATQQVELWLAPHKGKGFGVYHNAYGHFSEAFSVHAVASVSQMPEQRISAKKMYQLQKELEGASCIVVEQKSAKTERLARVLKVRQVEADPLASNVSIGSYKDFLLYLGGAFESCFGQ